MKKTILPIVFKGKFLLLLLFLTVVLDQTIYSQSQNLVVITGYIIESSTKNALEFASASLLTLKDSTLVKGGITNSKGGFVFSNVTPGIYKLRASFMGYTTVHKIIIISGTSGTQNLGDFLLDASKSLMDEVVITGTIPVLVKKDTLEYNADMFKVEKNAVVEDMLKKLPGVEIDGEGKIKAQGMDVTRVFVDGKPFFGNDPLIATQNLPAEMIAKIQVIDKKSDQAEFSGVDDGEVEKIINIVTRQGFKQGTFGKLSAGYGSLDRYDAGAMINNFAGERQMSVLGMSNNTNAKRFTLDTQNTLNNRRKSTLSGARAGRAGAAGGARAGATAGRGASGNGVTITNAAGANFHNLIGLNLSVTGSYFYNASDNNNSQTSLTQTFKGDTSIYKNDTSTTFSSNNNHRINMEIAYQIDSLNSIVFKPNISYGMTSSNRSSTGITNGESGFHLNESNNANRSEGTNLNSSSSLLYRRKFKKPRRTFSINLGGNLKYNNTDSYRDSFIKKYMTRTGLPTVGITDINTISNSSGNGYNIRLSYTEPISLYHSLDLNYYYSRSNNRSTKAAFGYNELDSLYNMPDTTYSNRFDNIFINQRLGLSLQTMRDKLIYTFGVGIESSEIESKTILLNKLFDRTHKSLHFSPTASLNYSFTNRRRLSLQYKGTTNEPSIDQLQPIVTDSNSLITRIGNPDLKSSFTNDLIINYNDVNVKTFTNFFANIQYSNEQNSISNNYINGLSGEQVIIPVNVNGAWDASTNVGMGKSIAKNKYYISTSGSLKWNKDVNFNRNSAKTLTNFNPLDTAGSVLNTTRTLTAGYNLQGSMNTENLMFTLSGRVNYNHVWQANLTNVPSVYMNYNLLGDVKLFLPWGLMISTDYQINLNSGYSKSYNKNYALWNATATKELLKSRRAQLKFQIFDILKQNQSIRRSVTGRNISDTRSTILPQYFIFTFIYNFKNFQSTKGEGKQAIGKQNNNMRQRSAGGRGQNKRGF